MLKEIVCSEIFATNFELAEEVEDERQHEKSEATRIKLNNIMHSRANVRQCSFRGMRTQKDEKII